MTKTYIERCNSDLRPTASFRFAALDLFAGCGGLSLGFESCGIHTTGYEMESDYAETYRNNLAGDCLCTRLHVDQLYPAAQIVIGGPPCQPFSVGGKQLGTLDSRDGFPVFIEAVRRVNPDLWLFENVRGLLYRNRSYFDDILNQLKGLNYIVEYRLLNAVDFGVPQNRERLIVVGHRGDFRFPDASVRKVTAGEALGELASSVPADARFLTASMDRYVANYEKASKCVNPRDLHLDRPARTLTCRNLAGATGDLLRVRLPDGRRRRIAVREAARLQGFPDWFEFSGTETSQYYQIGNAVPPVFARAVAQSVVNYLVSSVRYSSSEILYRTLPPQVELFAAETGKDDYAMPEFIPSSRKSRPVKKVINEALHIMNSIGIPFEGMSERRLERMGMAFLAVVDVKRSRNWPDAKQSGDGWAPHPRQIIEYINTNFEEDVSSGSFSDIRSKDLKLATVAGIIEHSANDPKAATNNSKRGYALNSQFTYILRLYGKAGWQEDIDELLSETGALKDRLSSVRNLYALSVKLPDGQSLHFSHGHHNDLQKAVIEEFLPRYGYGAEVLYVGDTDDKFLLCDKAGLSELRFFDLNHDELPDILAYSESRNWLFLIDVLHGSGPINAIRLEELKRLTKECTAEIVYITAFLDRAAFRKYAPDIAWETEVWIADAPDHLIHFNGDKFLGPHEM